MPRKWSVGCCSLGFEQPSPREVARRPPRPPPPHYARLAHPPRAVERGLSTDLGGAGVAGAPPAHWLHLIRWHHWWRCCGSRTPRRGRIKWRRAHAAAPKIFPQFATIWRRNLGVADNRGLPHIYHLWANSTKAERRTALQTAFNERVESGLSASRTTPWPPRSSTRWWSRGNSPPTCLRGRPLKRS